MPTVQKVQVEFREDSTNPLRARMTASDGTGAVQADGSRLLKQADYSALTLAVFDLSSDTPGTAVWTATLTVSAVVYDTLQLWGTDTIGYNFLTTLAASVISIGEHVYLAEVRFVTTGNTVGFVQWEGPALGVLTS